MELIIQPITQIRLGDVLQQHLLSGKYIRFQAAIAFVKRTGVRHLQTALNNFTQNGGEIRLVIGLDHRGTSYEGLKDLLETVGESVWLYHADIGAGRYHTFHSKMYLFEGDNSSLLVVGSGNLTEGGLFTNDEAAIVVELLEDDRVLAVVRQAFDIWCDLNLGAVKKLTAVLLDELLETGYVQPERIATSEDEAISIARHLVEDEQPQSEKVGQPRLFGQGIIRRSAPRASQTKPPQRITSQTLSASQIETSEWFALAVIKRDLPLRNSSPEISITKGIRDVNPAFWGWREQFSGPDARGQYSREVRIRFEDVIIRAYLKDFPARKPDGTKASADFRLGAISPIVQSLYSEGDVVVLERKDDVAFDYEARIIPVANLDQFPQLHDNLIEYPKSRSQSGFIKKYLYG